ncbi:MAG: hypothetical protein JOY93_08940, partial [Acidobacteriales bacterium]|nr:hypothetical protein [Terriglobales bacterium]
MDWKPPLNRREMVRLVVKAAAAFPVIAPSLLNLGCGGGASNSSTSNQNPAVSDDQFLDNLERASFLFFWEQASPVTGQVKDRATASGNDTRTVSSIASTGFGLTALCIADQRGYQDSASIHTRVLATLKFLAGQTNVNGFYYHWVDMNTGQRLWNSEVSSIDTAILMCGVLSCRQYFQNSQIQNLATQIYQRVNWQWMLNGGVTLSQGCTPENGFLPSRWDIYCELMMLYLLAIGSPTNPIPASSWDQIVRPTLTYQGLTYVTNYNAPLFIHQFSHAWFDFRNKQDAYSNYFN